jgi:ABC-type microcin C transport system permease subunit YejE
VLEVLGEVALVSTVENKPAAKVKYLPSFTADDLALWFQRFFSFRCAQFKLQQDVPMLKNWKNWIHMKAQTGDCAGLGSTMPLHPGKGFFT